MNKSKRTYPVGFYLRLFVVDVAGIVKGDPGRYFFGQWGQQKNVAWRCLSIARQLSRAIMNLWIAEWKNYRRTY